MEISKFMILSSNASASAKSEFIVSSSFSEFASSYRAFASSTAFLAFRNLFKIFEILVFSLPMAPAFATSCQRF